MRKVHRPLATAALSAGLFAVRDVIGEPERQRPAVVFQLDHTPLAPHELAWAWPDGRFAFVPVLD
ncbi:MAG: hypothetical protein ACOYNI_09695 [Acidimicrobiia bacterium]